MRPSLRLIELQAGLRAHHPRLEIEFLAGASGTNLPRCGRQARRGLHQRRMRRPAAGISGAVRGGTGGGGARKPARAHHLLRHPRAGRPSWVYTSPDCAHFRVMRSLFEAHCCEPSKTLLANQEDALRAMVGAGVGLASCAARTSSRPARRPRSTPCRWRCPRSACVSPICASVPMTRWCAHWWRNCLTCGRWRRRPSSRRSEGPPCSSTPASATQAV